MTIKVIDRNHRQDNFEIEKFSDLHVEDHHVRIVTTAKDSTGKPTALIYYFFGTSDLERIEILNEGGITP